MSTNTRIYSERLGSISDEQLQQALDRFDLGHLVKAEPVHHGFSGQNIFLTSTAGEWVLRGAPHDEEQFARERFFVDQLHERTSASVPWPYLVEESAGIFDWGFAIMPRLPGLQLAEKAVRVDLGLESRKEIARELGRTLRDMQRLTWPHSGQYDASTGKVAPLSTEHGARVRARTDRLLQRMPGLTEEDRAWGRALIGSAKAALDVPFAFCFVMMDYHENNILASPAAGGGWALGVVDFASSYFGDGERDLVRCGRARRTLRMMSACRGRSCSLMSSRRHYARSTSSGFAAICC